MNTTTRRLSLLLALLAMFGLTIYAHRIIASAGGTFLPDLLRAGVSTGGTANKPEIIGTSTSAAALTRNLFVPETTETEDVSFALQDRFAKLSYHAIRGISELLSRTSRRHSAKP